MYNYSFILFLFRCFLSFKFFLLNVLLSLFEALLTLTVGAGENSHEIMEEARPELCRILSGSDQSKMPAVCSLILLFFHVFLDCT